MRMNTLKPAVGAKFARKRVGRGRGSGSGGTAGRGTKGQKSRSGGYHKTGFEGGQMPLHRRLPKRGFRSKVNKHTAEIRLNELAKVEGDIADLAALQKAGVIGAHITRAKAILSGEIGRAVTLRGVTATKGAKAAIEAAGGVVEEVVEVKVVGKLVKKGEGKTDTKVKAKTKTDTTVTDTPVTDTEVKSKSKTDAETKTKTKTKTATETKTDSESKSETKTKDEPKMKPKTDEEKS